MDNSERVSREKIEPLLKRGNFKHYQGPFKVIFDENRKQNGMLSVFAVLDEKDNLLSCNYRELGEGFEAITVGRGEEERAIGVYFEGACYIL